MTELAKNLYCIQMRSGVEIWVEYERAVKLQNILQTITASKFILFEEESINTADIVGIFKAGTMQDLTRRKNGEWLCQQGTWHQRGDKCTCGSKEEREYIEKRSLAIKNCGKCTNGWIQGENGMRECDCLKDIIKPKR